MKFEKGFPLQSKMRCKITDFVVNKKPDETRTIRIMLIFYSKFKDYL